MNAACDRCRIDLPTRAAGTLDDDARAAVDDHLAHCEDCRVVAADWQLISQAVVAQAEESMGHVPVPVLMGNAAIDSHAAVDDGTPDARYGTGEAVMASPAHWWSDARNRLTNWLTPRGVTIGLAAAAAVVIVAGLLLGLQTLPQSRSAQDVFRATATAETTAVAARPGPGPSAPDQVPTEVARRPTSVARQPHPPLAALRPGGATNAASSGDQPIGAGQPSSTHDQALTSPVELSRTTPDTVVEPHASPTSPPDQRDEPEVPSGAGGSGAEPTSAATDEPPPQVPTSPVSTDQPTVAPTIVPEPTLMAGGVVSGRALGPDGTGRAEVVVRAYPADGAATDLPLAVTDVAGTYSLTLPAGDWHIGVEAPAYQAQWYPDRAVPSGVAVLTITDGGLVSDVDFHLLVNPSGFVAGRVSFSDGSPAERAMVVGVFLEDPSNLEDPGQTVAVTFTRADGTYELYLAPGVYAFTVHRDWRAAPSVWWDGRDSLTTCDLMAVDVNGGLEAVDFVLQ